MPDKNIVKIYSLKRKVGNPFFRFLDTTKEVMKVTRNM